MPDRSCHMTRHCKNGNSYFSGLSTTTCSKGLCECNFGLKAVKMANGDYECKAGGMTDLASAVARNASADEIADLIEFQHDADQIVVTNVLIFGCWVAGFMAVLVSTIVFVVRRRRSSSVAEEQPDYAQLLG